MKQVYLIGAGLGTPETMTVQGCVAAKKCKVLLGAARLLEPWQEGHLCIDAVTARALAEQIALIEDGPIGVLFSGDTGFYSGARALLPLLEDCQVETIPGISSLSWFCARLGIPWQDVKLVSAHGRSHNALGEVQSHEKTFLLTGGHYRVEHLCAELVRGGLGHLQLAVGERLGYPEEQIRSGSASELAGEKFDSLAVALVVNPEPVSRECAVPGIPDEEFLRGNAPMTKQEIRTLALSRLKLRTDDVVWDVGAGTGSVSVECALTCAAGQVYAIERKEEALDLLERNRDRFGASNLHVIAGVAPDVLSQLPAPDRVFLGGTGGELETCVSVILEKNPRARLVVTAITLETLSRAVQCFESLNLQGVNIVQAAVTRTKKVGDYHMAEGQNPVWIISGEGVG